MNSRYPQNWTDIAYSLKEKAKWRCQKCGVQCIKPGDKTAHLSKSERAKITMVVHHRNYQPEDNREENLVCVCKPCHLSYHTRKRGNISIGQLSLPI
ncbi:HNH endonuclease (plasmid) [Cyanobacterium sp. IPPAS B-1200]|uniref:HNH endonuclease n=1 Tax=Cyanobacterium sp. IPPAS B-1200 TaxID=1562720 RepID=UPI00085259CB|nr:HNH endonuclease [Cyanobacterium sp. IPPAS B-1200]OEJ78154.1 HNH endonuclease [Cyanobacterium sp. IPPAS B-1200]